MLRTPEPDVKNAGLVVRTPGSSLDYTEASGSDTAASAKDATQHAEGGATSDKDAGAGGKEARYRLEGP